MDELTIGQVAFKAYNKSTGGLTWDKKPIPPWAEIPDGVKAAWETAANAVIDFYDPDSELIDAEFEAEPNDSDDAEG